MISSGSALRRAGPAPSRLASAICAGTATVALILAPSCSSRSGGGAAASPAPAAAKAAPEILHFGGDKTAILAGQTFHLTADFANGSAAIEPGDLAVTSGVPMTLTPDVTTTYTLTVTDSAGDKTVETASVPVAPLVSGMALLAGEFNGLGDVDGVGALARFCRPQGVAVDGAGNVFVADTSNCTIRKITQAGVVSTFAGTAGQYGAVDSQGAAARFRQPRAITIDAKGNLYVIDSGKVIRRITSDGTVTTLNTHGSDSLTPFGYLSSLVADGAGTLFVTDAFLCTINRITSDGTVTTLAGQSGVPGTQDGNGTSARFQSPLGITLDAEGILYVADAGLGVRTITPSGEVNSLAAPGQEAFANAIVVDRSGTIYVTNIDTIEIIPRAGAASTLAGNKFMNGTVDGPGTSAGFRNLVGLTLDSEGSLYAVDSADAVIRKITKDAVVSTLAGKAQSSTNTSTDGLGESAHFSTPSGMATDAQGNTYVADLYGNAIRKIKSTGEVETLAGQLGAPGYQNGEGSQALFTEPSAVAVDSAGIVYVADNGNSVIRKITPQGAVSLLAGNPGEPGNRDGDSADASFDRIPAIAVDGAGDVYVAQPNTVRKVDAASGAVTTLAGVADADPDYVDGAATDARFNGLGGIAVDGKTGTIYVSDRNNARIRRIMPDGETTTLAGSGAFGHQDGPHDTATFGALASLTLDGAGTYLYVADISNDLIRRISTSDGSVTTEVGTPGKWGTVPGPLPANLNAPAGVAWDPTGPGHLLISVPDAILRVTF